MRESIVFLQLWKFWSGGRCQKMKFWFLENIILLKALIRYMIEFAARLGFRDFSIFFPVQMQKQNLMK